jgi:restriction endonuclease S subunit
MKCSEVSFKKILTDNSLLRFDAEYYSPEYVEAEKSVKSKPHEELRNLISVLTDYHANGSYEILRNNVQLLDYPDYALMIRTVDFERDDFEHDVKYISTHAYDFLKKTQIFGKEIIINKIGNAGKVYIVPPLNRKISLGMNQFMIRPTKDMVDGYLYSYLISKYGSRLLQQKITGAVPLSIDKESVRSVLVPILDHGFQDRIDRILNSHFDLRSKSKELYSQAEQILLSELGLVNWKPKHQLSFVKNFSDTKTADRIDADYFQPMYDELIERIKQYRNGYKTLGECTKIKDTNFVPKADVTYKYIELANIAANGIINGFTEAEGKELPSRARRKVNTGDVIVSSIEGSLSSTALINDDLNNALCSTGFYVINSDAINSETLLVLLKSKVGQLQLKKGCSGTILTAINNEEFKLILLPDISDDIQEAIKQKISEMYKAKSASKKLLNIAKRGVEMAIEQNEEEATRWLNEEVESR